MWMSSAGCSTEQAEGRAVSLDERNGVEVLAPSRCV